MSEAYWLDANVVIRFLTGKPEDMAEESRVLMEKAEEGSVSLKLTLVVLAEIYWVLFSYYEFSRERIDEVLGQFIKAQGIRIENKKLAEEALSLTAEKDIDFVDALLGLTASDQEESVVTFDEEDFGIFSGDWSLPGDVYSD